MKAGESTKYSESISSVVEDLNFSATFLKIFLFLKLLSLILTIIAFVSMHEKH